jgi:hypothetical protein
LARAEEVAGAALIAVNRLKLSRALTKIGPRGHNLLALKKQIGEQEDEI